MYKKERNASCFWLVAYGLLPVAYCLLPCAYCMLFIDDLFKHGTYSTYSMYSMYSMYNMNICVYMCYNIFKVASKY